MNSIKKAQTGNDASIIRFPGGSSNTVSKDYCPGIMTQLVNDVTARGLFYLNDFSCLHDDETSVSLW